MNFDLRRRIYGDEHLGPRNLQMIETARKLGLPAKFAGSGGAVIGLLRDPDRLEELERLYGQEGFSVLIPQVAEEIAEAAKESAV